METLLVVPVFTIAVALFAVLILLHFVPMGYGFLHLQPM